MFLNNTSNYIKDIYDYKNHTITVILYKKSISNPYSRDMTPKRE